MKKELIVHRDPKSPISEVFRTLRTNIQFMNINKKLKSLLITSTSPGEGKSWVASNLAVTFAQAGKRVILVDADMRKGRQYTIFGALPKPGLSNYLSGYDEYEEDDEEEKDITQYIQKTKVNNLCLMSAGNIPPNPSELLISPRMIKLMDELKELADIVIIDGTPCELVTDSVILSRIVDTTVIVTAHETTRKDSLQRVITSIKNVNGNIAGVVYNKVPVSNKRYQQSYYYGTKKDGKSKKRKKKRSSRDWQKREMEVSQMYSNNDSEEENYTYNNNIDNIDNDNDNEMDFNLELNNQEDILNEINRYIDNENLKDEEDN